MKTMRDNWLTSIFGYDVYGLRYSENAVWDDFDMPSTKAFLYAKVPTRRVDLVRHLSLKDFAVVDVNVTFEVLPSPRCNVIGRGIEIREIAPEHESAILDIAESCFVYSRFHLDSNISNDLANKVKRMWVHNYVTRNRGERLLVVLKGSSPSGFLAELASQDGQRAIRVIDLIGVAKQHQGKGLGRSLVNYLINDCVDKVDAIQAGTQVANIPSMRLYEHCGFRIVRSAYVMHAHIE